MASNSPALRTGAEASCATVSSGEAGVASAFNLASSSAANFAAAARSTSLAEVSLEVAEETLLRSIPFSSFERDRLPKAMRLISVGQINPTSTKLPPVQRPIAQAGSRHQA